MLIKKLRQKKEKKKKKKKKVQGGISLKVNITGT